MKRTDFAAILGMTLVLGCFWGAQAQNVPKITAQIAAPSRLNLEAAHSFPVSIRGRIFHNGSRPLENLTIQAPGAWIFCDGKIAKDGAMDVVAKHGEVNATIRLRPAAIKDKNEYKCTVAPTEAPELILAAATIKMRRAASIEAVETSEVLWAKSKTPQRLRFIVRDQNKQPLESVPCFARYTMQPHDLRYFKWKQDKTFAVCSDAQGMMTIEPPVPIVAGRSSLRVWRGDLSSKKVEFIWRMGVKPQ